LTAQNCDDREDGGAHSGGKRPPDGEVAHDPGESVQQQEHADHSGADPGPLQQERLDERVGREVADHEQKCSRSARHAVRAAAGRSQLPKGDRLIHPDRRQKDHLQYQGNEPSTAVARNAVRQPNSPPR